MTPAGDATSGDAPALCLSILFLSTLVVGCDRPSRTQGLAIHTSAGIWVRVQVSQVCKVDQNCSVTAWQMSLSDSEEVRRASRLLSAFVSSQIQALQLDPVPQYISP